MDMLNELLTIERGLRAAGIEMVEGHPDIKDVGRMPMLLVRLDRLGSVSSVRAVPSGIAPWTMRDGQHNSFPFVKLAAPLWAPSDDATLLLRAANPREEEHVRREAMLRLAGAATINEHQLGGWPGRGYVTRLRERGRELISLRNSDGMIMRATIGRFLRGCRPLEIQCHQ